MQLLDVILYGFAAYVTYDMARNIRSGRFKRYMIVFARRTPKDWFVAFGLVLLNMSVVIGTILALASFKFAPLHFSWLNLFASKEHPNPSTNVMVAPVQIPYFGIVFFLLLMLNIPRLAWIEEESFRLGTKTWKEAIPRSLKFGFAHMLVGVPVYAAIALGFGGMFFTWQYFRGGLRQSAFYHTLHNMLFLSLLGWILLFQR